MAPAGMHGGRVKKREKRPAEGARIEHRDIATRAAAARSSWLDPREPYLVPLLLLVASRLLAWVSIPAAAEDAYITFRYARNLVSGYGLVYNPGEHVMGFTSPLWTLWSAFGVALVQDPVPWARATTLVADGITLVLAVRLLRRHASSASAWIFAVFFAAWPYFAAVAVSGMENSVMLTFIVLSAWAVERRHALAGPALAALAATRPEGVAVAVLIALRATPRDRIVAATLALLVFAALGLYYGSPVPQSVFAKSTIYGTPGPWLGRHWWEWVFPMALGRWPVTGEGSMMLPLQVLVAPGLVLGVLRLWRVRGSGLALAVAGMLVVWAGYALLGVAYFYWYMIVPLAGVALAVAVGLPGLLRGPGVLVACVLFVLGTWTISRPLYIGRAQNEVMGFGGAADYLSREALPGEKIMLEPIGIIGYTVPLKVIDEVGLVSPAVAKRRLQGAGWYADVAAREQPDWIVIRATARSTGTSFAGVGAPFRSAAERDSLFARYANVYISDPGRSDLEVWRRIR
jgi:hypothetical protein